MAEEANNHLLYNYEPFDPIGGLTTFYEYYNTFVTNFISGFQNQDYNNADLWSVSVFNMAAQIIEYLSRNRFLNDTIANIQNNKKVYMRSAEISYYLYQALEDNGLAENRRRDIIKRTIKALKLVARSFSDFASSRNMFAVRRLQRIYDYYREIDNINYYYRRTPVDLDIGHFRMRYTTCTVNIQEMITEIQEIEREANEQAGNVLNQFLQLNLQD